MGNTLQSPHVVCQIKRQSYKIQSLMKMLPG